jgi:predicted small secreted protein
MKKLSALVALAFAMGVSLTACNTIEGAGQDIQKGGQKLEDAADKKK